MRIAANLYRRFAYLVHELAKFGTVGAIGFVLNYGLTNLLRFGVGWGALTSNVVATAATATFAYFANRFWTFRHREQSGLAREYFLFFVFNGVGLLIQILAIGFTTYTLKLTGPLAYNAALTVGVVGGTLFRYWSYKKWVFLPSELPVGSSEAERGARLATGSTRRDSTAVPLRRLDGVNGRDRDPDRDRRNGSRPPTRAR